MVTIADVFEHFRSLDAGVMDRTGAGIEPFEHAAIAAWSITNYHEWRIIEIV